MNSGPLLFLGIFLSMAGSFWGLILLPQIQIGRQQPITLEATGAIYPVPRAGEAQQGAEVYRSLGCVECHSQQVRVSAGDFQRGWGRRIAVAQDYLYENPVLVGNQRIGPDLANYGLRATAFTNILQHLYHPQGIWPESMMPSYRFLFERRKLARGEKEPADTIFVLNKSDLNPGEAIVPRPAARALAAYLQSLRADVPLFEAPVPRPATNAPPAATTTNAPVAPSPAPAK